MMSQRIAAILGIALLSACAVRLGGPEPEEYRTLALDAGSAADPDDVAAQVREAEANVVLLAAREEAPWFQAVAERAGLHLSGPSTADPVAFGFLAGEPIGDTTVVLSVADADEPLILHDALYRVGEHRFLDLMATRIGPATDLRDAVHRLMEYVATDVMTDAAVVLAVDVARPERADSVASLLRPAFLETRECLADDGDDRRSALGLRLFHGPEARVRCEEAEVRADALASILARLTVTR